MSSHSSTKRLTRIDMQHMFAEGEKIAMLTCYDSSFAALCSNAGVDALLIGDCLGMVIKGDHTTLTVLIDDIVYHTQAVAKGSVRPMIISDMPFGSFQEGPQSAFHNAAKIMAAGAQMVKIEGGVEMAETTAFLTTRGIPVCAHIGLTPQSVHQLGGYRLQGKDDATARVLIESALAHQEAGAAMLLMECVAKDVADRIVEQMRIPTIGIGASDRCAGQVLVLYDVLGISTASPRFARNFLEGTASVGSGIDAYVRAVKSGVFPDRHHCYP